MKDKTESILNFATFFCITGALAFACYGVGYGEGKSSAKCNQRHSYDYKNVQWFAHTRKHKQ